jgi:hypothetical protein
MPEQQREDEEALDEKPIVEGPTEADEEELAELDREAHIDDVEAQEQDEDSV